MANFEVLFELKPPGAFGLPEQGWTVLPTPIKNAYGPTLDTKTGQIVSHGTLSVFRREQERIKEQLRAGQYEVKLCDNFMLMKIEAPTPADALASASDLARKIFLRWAVFAGGVRFEERVLQMTDIDGRSYHVPQQVARFDLRGYNLESMRTSFRQSVAAVQSGDQRLERALVYFDRFLLLEEFSRKLNYLGRAYGYLVGEMLLNLYKSITTILGDPKRDRDYQKRFRKIGLPENFWIERVKPIKVARDDLDVAHYRLTESPEVLRKRVAKAGKACQETITAYIDWLRCNPPGSTPKP